MLLTQPPSAERRRKRTRGGVDTHCQATADDVIRYLREQQVTLTYDPAAPALHAENGRAATTMSLKEINPARKGRRQRGGKRNRSAGRPPLA
jgi:hypothetical protein